MNMPRGPQVQILEAMQDAAAAADYSNTGLPVGAQLTVRQRRNRNTPKGSRPCLTLIFVTDVPVQADLNINQYEKQRNMTVDLQVDVELTPELEALDKTGIQVLTNILGVALRAIRAAIAGDAPGAKCDWIEGGELDPEDRATPEDGRLVREAIVVYRVLQDDEDVLLAEGADP